MSIILWIDPGTTDTWFAVIKKTGGHMEMVDFGSIRTTPNIELSEKLREISADLDAIIEKYRPDCAGIEKIFFLKNTKTAIDVAHARWVMLLQLRNSAVPIMEYSPSQIKKAICNNGRAPKKQVQNALKILFQLEDTSLQDDAADALAVAYITGLYL